MAKRFLPTLCFKLPSSVPLPRRNSRKNNNATSASPTPAAAAAAAPSSSSGRKPQLRRVFQRIDADGDGQISPAELRAVLSCSGEDEPEDGGAAAEAAAAFGGMDYEEFLRLMEEGAGEECDIRLAFTAFEAEKGSGCITADGLRRTLHRLGEAWWTPEDCARMIRAYDADGNGVIDYHEFRAMMMMTAV